MIEGYSRLTAVPWLLCVEPHFIPSGLLPFVTRETGQLAFALETGTW